MVRGVDDQRRFGRHLKQQPVAGLDLAQSRIVPLHRHLRFNELVLQLRHRAQIAPKREEAVAAAEFDGGVKHRDLDAARRFVMDLAPAGFTFARGLLQHGRHFGPAFDSNRLAPGSTEPLSVTAQFGGKVGLLEGDVVDHAVTVDDERDIGRGLDHIGRGTRGEIAQRLHWGFESLHVNP